MEDFYQGSGGWYKSVDGSGPYVKDGDNFTLLGSGGGGSGGHVDVLGTQITDFTTVNSKVGTGDTVLQALEKLQGQTDNIPLPSDISSIALQTKLIGLRELPADDLLETDTLLNAFGKLLGTVNMLKARVSELESK